MGISINTGLLFKTEDNGNKRQPKYRGKINVDGKELNIALYEEKATSKFNTDKLTATIS